MFRDRSIRTREFVNDNDSCLVAAFRSYYKKVYEKLSTCLKNSQFIAMNEVKYSALIRTYNSEKTLPSTLASLINQTVSPSKFIFVDSGSNDSTLHLLPNNSIVHNYVGNEFNFSESINQGLEYVSTDFVLILSSHTTLMNCEAINYALNILCSNEKIGATYFDYDFTGGFRYRHIDKNNFNGFNGLMNTCSLIRVSLLRRRRFRPEVFSAEDQEWARWLIYHEGKATACISGAGMVINNPRKDHLKKK